MKVLTLNCHAWQEENQAYKIKYLAKQIKEQSYDVIALQEVSQPMINKEIGGGVREGNYILALLEELRAIDVEDYDFAWGLSHIGYEVYEEGLGLLSKHPIIEKENFFITNGTDTNYWKTRKIVRITLEYKGELIDCFSCHLGWWEDEEEPFKGQVDKLNAKVNPERLSLIMGDFNNNANLVDKGYDYMISKGWLDTYTAASQKDQGITIEGKIDGWEKNKEDLRIDLIFTNKPVEVKTSKVMFNGIDTQIVSDHYGVAIEI